MKKDTKEFILELLNDRIGLMREMRASDKRIERIDEMATEVINS